MMNIEKTDQDERAAIEHLKSDRVWEWCMSKNQFDKIVSQYKSLSPIHSLGYLAMEVMGYGKEDIKSALSNFLRVRQGKMRTNGWAIFKLAMEINEQCNISISPFDLAQPTGKNSDASKNSMAYLWLIPEMEAKLRVAAPKVHELFQKNGIDIPEKTLTDGIMAIIRRRFTKWF